MIITSVSALAPRYIPLAEKLIRHCTEESIPTVVIETRRELTTQIAYFLRSRAPVAVVKAVFARCELWAITDAEAAALNTQTLYSKHIDGLAMDLAPAKSELPWWNAPLSVWERIWHIAEDECGLDACAGGKWQAWQKNGRPWDLPHIEFRNGALDDFRHQEGIA
jgi:hypothetical protein